MSGNNNSAGASGLLVRQLKDLKDPKKGIPSFHIELENNNIFLWNVGVMVLNVDSIYHGGYFKAQMRFPLDFPYSPPTFRFTPPIYHPNVYKDGKLCISILHQGGDPTTDELDRETWLPVQSAETVLISIISLLEDPNVNSPANVDAAVDWRKDRESYNAKVKTEVERSKKDIPEDFVMPSAKSAYASYQTDNDINDIIDENVLYDNSDQSYDEDSLMEENFEYEDDEDDGAAEEVSSSTEDK